MRFVNGWVVAANVFPNGTNSPVSRRALYLVHTRTGRMPIPEGDFLFAYPMPIVTPDGILHLFWAEGVSAPAPLEWPYSLTAIWHSEYRAERWSLPERVVDGQYVSWQARAPQVAVDDHGNIHLVAEVAAAGRGDELVLFTLANHIWRRLGTGIHDGYPSIVTFGAGNMALVTVASDAYGPNQLRERRSTDHGETWSTPRRILSEADTGAAYNPQLRQAGGRLFLGWLGGSATHGSTWRLSHRAMGDSAWEPPATVTTPGLLLNAPFEAVRCGDVTALAETISPSGVPIVRQVLVREQGIALRVLSDSIALAPGMASVGDTIFEVWSRASVSGHGFEPYWRETSLCGR